ncbi:MAG: PstA family ABC transporter permease, partial [Fusobacteriaceae bacterium]
MSILKGKVGKSLEIGILILTIVTIIPVLFILGYIIYKGMPAINWEFLTAMPRKGMRAGGIFPAIVGTIYLTLGTIAVAVPFGVFTGIYLVEYAKDNFLTRMINLTIVNLAGIPSIIYGLFGMALFVIHMKMGVSILSGSLTLGIMCLPVIITSTRESLLAVPNS